MNRLKCRYNNLQADISILDVNLNKKWYGLYGIFRQFQRIINFTNTYSIYAIEREIVNWPNKQKIYRKQKGTGPYRYKGLDYSQ